MPLTDDGFVELNEDDELEHQRQLMRDSWNDPNLDLSEHSILGNFVLKATKNRIEEDQDEEQVYDAGLIDSSTGVSLDRLAANYAASRANATSSTTKLQVTGTPGYVITADPPTEFDTEDGTVFWNAYDTQIGADGTAELTVYSDDQADYVNVNANTITVQANPVDEIETVTNKDPATGGADLQTDYDLRRQMLLSTSATENGTADGLKVALMNVAGVSDAQVISNRTEKVDSYGNPPHTVHCYVMGGTPADIAQKLFDVAGADQAWVGDTAVNAYDDGGHAHEVRFDVQQQVTIKFALVLKSAGGVDEDAVKQSVLEYIETLQMGDPVILNQLYGYLYQVDGVDYVNSISAGLKDPLGTTDVAVTAYQQAISDDDSIEVTVNAS